MFSVGNYLKIWDIKEGKTPNYYEVEGSTSRKNKDGEYETDFSSKFIRFVSKAREAIDSGAVEKGGRVKIVSCGVSNSYNKETQKGYTNFVIFEVEPVDGGAKHAPAKKVSSKEVPAEGYETPDDDLPF